MTVETLREQLRNAAPEQRSRMLLEFLALGGPSASELDLRGLDLANARLPRVSLPGADLRNVNLSHASLPQADLSDATLEEVTLTNADLAGAQLAGARLGGANLHGALLDEANLTGTSLRFAHVDQGFLERVNLARADLWGASLTKTVLIGADMRDCLMHETDLSFADLSHADLRGAKMETVNLVEAQLCDANLQGAHLVGVNLRNARLQRSKLQAVDLTQCDLTHVWISGAALEKTRFDALQLGGAVGEEVAGEYEQAQRAYLTLERNFEDLGEPDAASWAFRRKRRMQKMAARRRGAYIAYVADQLVEWICDYGESIARVMLSMLIVYLLFAVTYGVTGSVARVERTPHGDVLRPTHDVVDLLVFSLLAMTTSGSPAVGLQPRSIPVHLITGAQALIGIFLTGLLGFVLGNRIRR